MSEGTRVWRLITNHEYPEEAFQDFVTNGYIAMGWNMAGSVLDYNSPQEIVDVVRGFPTRNFGLSGKQLFSFCNEIQTGALVILSDGKSRRAVMRVTDNYEFRESSEKWAYFHRRKAERTAIDPDLVWKNAGAKPAIGFSMRWPLILLKSKV